MFDQLRFRTLVIFASQHGYHSRFGLVIQRGRKNVGSADVMNLSLLRHHQRLKGWYGFKLETVWYGNF